MTKTLLPLLIPGLLLGGCVHSDSDMDVKLPPGAGQPRKPSAQEQAMGNDARMRGDQRAAAANGRMMQQMAEARERSGGK